MKFAIIVLFTLTFSTVTLADNTRKVVAERIIAQLQSNNINSPDHGLQLVQKLVSLNVQHNSKQMQLLIRAKCWHQPMKNQQEVAKAIQYAKQQLKKIPTTKLTATMVSLRLCQSYYTQYMGELNEAFTGISNAINQAYQLENVFLVARGRSIRGAISSFQGNHSAAIEDLISAQELFESLQLPHWANANLTELAASYRRSGDTEKALKYQLALENSYLGLGKLFSANQVNIHIAASYEHLGNIEQAIKRYQQSRLFLLESNPILAADMSVSIANNLLILGQPNKALTTLKDAEKIITPQYNSPYSFLQLYFARTYYDLEQYTLALHALALAESSFDQDNNQRYMAKALLLKSTILTATKDYQNANTALLAYIDVHTQLDKQALSKRNAELQTQFDTDRIQNENTLLIQSAMEKELTLQTLKQNELLQSIIIILVAILLVFVSWLAYKQHNKKRQFKVLALTDELTKLANRRDTYKQAQLLFALCKKEQHTLSIISFDADNFKLVNDTLGHDIGDKVLVIIAQIAKNIVRDVDTVGRVGGEEFLVLLPNTNLQVALEITNRLLQAIANYPWATIAPDLKQTVSAGIACYQNEKELSLLIKKADTAQYKAKNSGRNRAEVQS